MASRQRVQPSHDRRRSTYRHREKRRLDRASARSEGPGNQTVNRIKRDNLLDVGKTFRRLDHDETFSGAPVLFFEGIGRRAGHSRKCGHPYKNACRPADILQP